MKLTIEVTNANLERTIASLLEEARETQKQHYQSLPDHYCLIRDRNAQRKLAIAAFQRGDLKSAIEHMNNAHQLDVDIAKCAAHDYTKRIFESMGQISFKQAETPEEQRVAITYAQ